MSEHPDQEEVEKSTAPLSSHLSELRTRLIRSLVALGLSSGLCFVYADKVYNFLVWPYDIIIQQTTGEHAVLIFTAPQEFFLTQLKIAFCGGLFISFPILATQLYLFIAPGLYKHEKRAFIPYLVATPLLFVLGVALVYFLLPLILGLFASMQQTGQNEIRIELLPKVSEYLDLVMALAFAFGLVFQLPILLVLMAKTGIFTAEDLKKKRRWAILLSFIAAAILTPPDPISQIALAIPAIMLYEVAILLVSYSDRGSGT